VQYGDGRTDTESYEWTDTVKKNLESFAAAIAGKGTYIFTDEQKVANIATLEAICRSALLNAPVAV